MRTDSRLITAPPQSERGATLIEVVVAMFVLAFGLLALVAMQLRTQGSVREAEYTTRVAQLTSNLVEGMLANPTLTANDTTNKGAAFRTYDNYQTSGAISATCTPVATGTTGTTQSALAQSQLCQFQQGLNQLPSATAQFIVCSGINSATAPRPNAFPPVCTDLSAGNDTMVRVVWMYQANAADVAGLKTGANTASGAADQIMYSYQTRVTRN